MPPATLLMAPSTSHEVAKLPHLVVKPLLLSRLKKSRVITAAYCRQIVIFSLKQIQSLIVNALCVWFLYMWGLDNTDSRWWKWSDTPEESADDCQFCLNRRIPLRVRGRGIEGRGWLVVFVGVWLHAFRVQNRSSPAVHREIVQIAYATALYNVIQLKDLSYE